MTDKNSSTTKYTRDSCDKPLKVATQPPPPPPKKKD